MAVLEWDKTGERYYEAGVSKAVLYRKDSTGAYPKGVAWNGLTSVTDSPDGAEETELWADNIKYGSIRSAETFGGTIEAYQSPEEFDACDGCVSVADGVTIGQQTRSSFGLSYVTQIGSDTTTTDDAYKIHIIYGATASPSEQTHDTINDSPDASTLSWEYTTTPVNVTGYKQTSSIVIDSRKADPAKLAALEEILYGSEDAEARLPLPDEIIALMGTTGA